MPFARTVLAALLLAMPAAADQVRAPDAARMAAFDSHLGAAMRDALAERPAPPDRAVLLEALSGPARAFDAPEGDWSCRTIKLGGPVPLVAYSNFACRIAAAPGGGWTLIKQTGSQRLKGHIAPDGLFRGVGHVGTAPATEYGGLPPADQTPVEPNQTTAEIGRFEQMDPRRARLMLPAPILESRFDILYLTR